MLLSSQWQDLALRALRAAFAGFVSATSDKAHFEVERKFALTKPEVDEIPVRLKALGFTYIGTAAMTDTFLPTFVDGEMMRVRFEQIGSEPLRTLLTYKQWVKTATGKERKESEREVGSTVGALWRLVGRAIIRQPLLSFSKNRQLFDGKLGDADAVVSIDDVSGLGNFSGSYMEVEVLVPLDGDVVAYRDRIFAIVKEILLEARPDVQRSYMDMLKESRTV
jgi:predicted adenylyl cyclase CyaB